MTETITENTAAQMERVTALRRGVIWAELADDDTSASQIAVWWPSSLNRNQAIVTPLKEIGAKATNARGLLPLSLTNCKELRRLFGDRLEISDGLNNWAFDEIERLGAIENFSSADSDAELDPRVAEQLPGLARMVHAYQRAGIAFITHTRNALLADQPGLGKTLQTIGAMANAGVTGDILVAAPSAAVATTWPDELATWAPGDEVIVVMGTGPKRHKIFAEHGIGEQVTTDDQTNPRPNPIPAPSGRRWVIVNLEMMRSQWIKPKRVHRKHKVTGEMGWFEEKGWWSHSYPELHNHVWAAFVIDESHRCLICHSAKPQSQTQVRAGAGMIPVAEDGLRIALSGTPFRGKVENLWGTLNWMDPEKYHAYWTWAQQWFHVLGDPRNPRESPMEINGLDETKAKAFYDDIAPIMLRRTKAEVRPELPDKLYAGTPLPYEDGTVDEYSPIGHWLTMSPKQAKAYQEIREQAETVLESGVLVANGVLAELTRLKQFAICHGDLEERADGEYKFLPQLPSTKFDWLTNFLAELGIDKDTDYSTPEDGAIVDSKTSGDALASGVEEIRKVVVASQFTSILNMYEKELEKLGIPCLKITGQVSQAQRKAAKDQWQSGEGGPRVFLLNTAAGGVSLTLDAADDLVFLDETWIPDEQEQVEDRIHRVSRLHQVTIHYLRTLGTIEENIALTTGSRERLTKMLIDGQRGVSFAKSLLTPIDRKKAA